MKRRFDMTVEQNIFVAKRNLVDYIWKSANLEGIVVTYPDTDIIINHNLIPESLKKIDDLVAINNLKHAWRFVLETIEYPTDFAFICEVNKQVGENLIYGSGTPRNFPVTIKGTDWKPDMPIESIIKEELEDILSMSNPTEQAITIMLYLMRKQIFGDGNKRTAMLVANHVMIRNGAGIISLSNEDHRKFGKMLKEYYETNEIEKVKQFVYESGIDGIEFPKEKKVDRKNVRER